VGPTLLLVSGKTMWTILERQRYSLQNLLSFPSSAQENATWEREMPRRVMTLKCGRDQSRLGCGEGTQAVRVGGASR